MKKFILFVLAFGLGIAAAQNTPKQVGTVNPTEGETDAMDAAAVNVALSVKQYKHALADVAVATSNMKFWQDKRQRLLNEATRTHGIANEEFLGYDSVNHVFIRFHK